MFLHVDNWLESTHGLILWLLHPLWWVAVFLLLSYFGPNQRRKQFTYIAWSLAFLLAIPWPVSQLIQQQERKFPPHEQFLGSIQALPAVHVLVLGAGMNTDTSLEAQQRVSPEVLMRLCEGMRHLRNLPNAKLITSGPAVGTCSSQAALLKHTATSLGIASERVAIQEQVHNTRTEAIAYVQRFGVDTPLVLCTSALHMPRAVAWFKKMGVQTIYAAPAHYMAPKSSFKKWRLWLPSLRTYQLWQAYLKERLGMIPIMLYQSKNFSTGQPASNFSTHLN